MGKRKTKRKSDVINSLIFNSCTFNSHYAGRPINLDDGCAHVIHGLISSFAERRHQRRIPVAQCRAVHATD